MRQRAGALCIDPEQGVTIVFMISKPKRGLLRRGEGPLMGAAALYPSDKGMVMGALIDNRGGRAMCVLRSRC